MSLDIITYLLGSTNWDYVKLDSGIDQVSTRLFHVYDVAFNSYAQTVLFGAVGDRRKAKDEIRSSS